MTLFSRTDTFKEFHPQTDKKGLVVALNNHAEGVFGAQLGYSNVTFYTRGGQVGVKNLTQKIDGYQVGLSNCADELNGFQIGLICQAGFGKFKQFGLLTIRENDDKPWYKNITPFFGFSDS